METESICAPPPTRGGGAAADAVPLGLSSPSSSTTTTSGASAVNSTLFAWGVGEDGQLGFEDVPVDAERGGSLDYCVDAPREVSEIGSRAIPVAPVAGSRNSMCVCERGTLYAWGWNSHRTLGHDWRECDDAWVPLPKLARLESVEKSKEDGKGLVVSQVSLGGWHAACVDRDGQCFAWGGNEYAQAGSQLNTDSGKIPDRDWAPVRSLVSPAKLVSLPAQVFMVSCGGMSSFALLRDGRVFEWGQTTEDDAPKVEPSLMKTDRHIVEIAAGSFHLLLRTRNGEVLSYGNGMYGQLGLGATASSDQPTVIETFGRVGVVKIAAGGWHSAAVTAGGLLFTWGRGEYGRLGHGDDCKDKVIPKVVDLGDDESNFIADVSLGGSHSCAVTIDGAVLSWGRTTLGRLGRVVTDPSPSCGFPGRVVFPPLPGGQRWKVTRVSCGGRHTLAVASPTAVPSTPA